MRTRVPACDSSTAPERVRLSRESEEWHTAHAHPICGTPKLVPVPRNVSFIYTTSTLSKFVVPGTSNGAPAVTQTRSLLNAIPKSMASRSAMATM